MWSQYNSSAMVVDNWLPVLEHFTGLLFTMVAININRIVWLAIPYLLPPAGMWAHPLANCEWE